MTSKIKFSAITTAIVVLTNLVFVTPSYAFWDLGTSYNFTGDSRNDVQAFSDYAKGSWTQRWDVYDSVKVLVAAPDTLTKLKFDWKISDGHRFSGTLPFNNKWKFTNHWYSYQYPRHKDFTLELTPSAVPAVAPFSRTAEAHYPWFPTDIITNLLSSIASEGGEVGGMLAFGNNQEEHSAQQVGKEFEPADGDAFKKSEASSVTKGLEKIFHVYATLNKNENGEFVYKYMAVNSTEQAVSGSWSIYIEDLENTRDVIEFEVGANEEKLLKEFSSKEQATELSGHVAIQLNDETFTFFAPAFAVVEGTSGESDSSSVAIEANDMLGTTDEAQRANEETLPSPAEVDSNEGDSNTDEDESYEGGDEEYEEGDEEYEDGDQEYEDGDEEYEDGDQEYEE